MPLPEQQAEEATEGADYNRMVFWLKASAWICVVMLVGLLLAKAL